MHKQHYSTWKRSSTIGGIAQRSDHRAHGSHLVALGLLGAHRWLISNSIKQIHEHVNTNTEIQIHREHMGHTWAVTEASWREAGGSCGLLPPLLPPTATPPPTQPSLCHRAFGAQNAENSEYVVQKNKDWSKIPESLPKIQLQSAGHLFHHQTPPPTQQIDVLCANSDIFFSPTFGFQKL